MKVSKISIDELLNELDKSRVRTKYEFNNEQKLLIAYSFLRPNYPVNKTKFNEIWTKLGYEKISNSTLRNYVRKNEEELKKILNNYLSKNKKLKTNY